MNGTDKMMQRFVHYGGALVPLGHVWAEIQRIAPNQACADRYIQGLLLRTGTMKIVLDKAKTETDQEYTLTTDHPASSYGQPVLVDAGGNAYGSADVVERVPEDVFGDPANITAGMLVTRWCKSHLDDMYKAIDSRILRFAGIV